MSLNEYQAWDGAHKKAGIEIISQQAVHGMAAKSEAAGLRLQSSFFWQSHCWRGYLAFNYSNEVSWRGLAALEE